MPRIFSTEDARRLAKRRLPWMVFDYIDGAAGEGHGEALNRQAIRDLRLTPRILTDVRDRNLGAQVFDHAAEVPFGISPMGMCNLSTPGADLMLADMAAKYQVPLGVSTVSSTSLETLIERAEGHAWFQLYFSGDGSGALRLVERAKAAGYKTLVLTVDVPEVGRRPRELSHGFTMPFKIGPRQFIDFALHPRWSLHSLFAGAPGMANFKGADKFDRTESRAAADWSYFQRLREAWDGNLVVKGVLDSEDAERLKKEGADAIQVSSHGGRQLDAAQPPILALREIRKAVGKEFPLFYDSGIRSGEDVLKAYAMGADFVFLGRTLLFAMAAGRKQGLSDIWDIFAKEISLGMAQTGLTNLSKDSLATLKF